MRERRPTDYEICSRLKVAMVERIGNCRVLGEIGSGGMAVVYEAIQEPLNRRVAIKALKPSVAIDSQFAERFEREAGFMALLQHENILHVIDFIKDGNSMYIVMEYVDGVDLYDLLDKAPKLPPEIAAIITLQLARGLDYAHFRGLIHRDIKPANIIISTQGEVKLMDFGIARHEEFGDLTETGTGLGTPSYMSPEQILGDKLDFKSDIFSVGIVLYQMLTGRKPFVEDDNTSVMQKIRLGRYTAPNCLGVDVPRKFERIMERCMKKLPANRYVSTQALVDDLVEFISPRVTMNHNARLVLYLRDIGLVTQAQADDVFAGSAPRAVNTGLSLPFLKRLAKVNGWMLAGLLASGLVVQLSSRTTADPPPIGLSALPISEAGHVRVVVDPWAEVVVDGEYAFTTPSAKRILLAPGRHYLKFINPYFQTHEHEVDIKPGSMETVQVKLKPKESVANEDGADS